MLRQITIDPSFSVEPYSSLNFDGPQYEGYAVVLREAGLPPEVVAVYFSAERAEVAADRLRKEARVNQTFAL